MIEPVFRFEIGRTPRDSRVIYLPTGEDVDGIKAFSLRINAADNKVEAVINIDRRWIEIVEPKT